jgi:N-formylglutamate deformylase
MPIDEIDDIRDVRGDWSGQLVATAIHDGHGLRPDVTAAMQLDERARRREEDPHTDVIGSGAPAQVVALRSRFEVDLNRPREEAVYREPGDCWGLQVWRGRRLDNTLVQGSLEVYDAFYEDLGRRLDEVAQRGPFVVYDVHSYNHRRDGDSAEVAAAEDNPEVNLGTGTVEDRFRPVVEAFTRSLQAQEVAGHRLDVRENVKFEGRALAWFVHGRYPGRGVCLALEFKKTFMDEWTGEVDESHLRQLQDALTATHGPVLEALAGCSR